VWSLIDVVVGSVVVRKTTVHESGVTRSAPRSVHIFFLLVPLRSMQVLTSPLDVRRKVTKFHRYLSSLSHRTRYPHIPSYIRTKYVMQE
jgi:hypothetical protein